MINIINDIIIFSTFRVLPLPYFLLYRAIGSFPTSLLKQGVMGGAEFVG